jgi:hypothetical protein
MAYASAKFAKALCDRCGFEYKLLDLKKEWNNLKTCPDCFETKHPRPNNDVEVGEGYILSNNDNIIGSPIPGYRMTASLGEVTITV